MRRMEFNEHFPHINRWCFNEYSRFVVIKRISFNLTKFQNFMKNDEILISQDVKYTC